ncbi:MAG: hypothetical protein ACRDYW_07400 [Acidimicrobiales bacterium]
MRSRTDDVARTVQGHGLSIEVPSGWEARISLATDGPAGGTRNPVLHAASAPLPEVRGDFGGGVVERLPISGVFIALIEYDREAAGTPLFEMAGLPRALTGSQFRTNTLQRGVAGQSGAQWFRRVRGRAFCLYVVLGAHRDRFRLATLANRVVQTIEVD